MKKLPQRRVPKSLGEIDLDLLRKLARNLQNLDQLDRVSAGDIGLRQAKISVLLSLANELGIQGLDPKSVMKRRAMILNPLKSILFPTDEIEMGSATES